jgi:hypothetical protein
MILKRIELISLELKRGYSQTAADFKRSFFNWREGQPIPHLAPREKK